jgi:hypothetical protein
VEGGSANAYDYTNQDPLNRYDLDGQMPTGPGDKPNRTVRPRYLSRVINPRRPKRYVNR